MLNYLQCFILFTVFYVFEPDHWIMVLIGWSTSQGFLSSVAHLGTVSTTRSELPGLIFRTGHANITKNDTRKLRCLLSPQILEVGLGLVAQLSV